MRIEPRTTGLSAQIALVAFAVIALTACSNKVWVMIPPDFDLTGYERIGMIEMACNDPALEEYTTQQFQQSVLSAQAGLRVIELGDEAQVLRSVGRTHLDAEAIQLIAAKHDLDAIFVGDLELSRVTPKLGVTMTLVAVTGRAEMNVMMGARLIETSSGATVWTNSSRGTITVAHASIDTEGTGRIGITDPEGNYASMVEGLAWRIACDFRTEYVKQKPEKVPPHYVPTYPDGVEVFAPPRLTSAER